MDKNYYYYTLKQSKPPFFKTLFNILIFPIRVLNWLISFLFSQVIAQFVVNALFIKMQKDIHLAKTTAQAADDIVVVNFKRMPRFKWLNHLLFNFKSSFGLHPQLKKILYYNNQDDKAYVDALLKKIKAVTEGTALEHERSGRKFDWSHIHLKGLEYLDLQMRAYVFEELDRQYGTEVYMDEKADDIEFYSLKTPDNAELDSVQITAPGEPDKSMQERKFVITCMARDQNYINWMKDLKYTATNLQATAISFNYRGIDRSRGQIWTSQDMVNDVLAQVERLTTLGAKPENICLDGMSQGGAIATIAAAKLLERNIMVNLNNERSFRSLPRLIFGYIAPDLQHAQWWNPLTYVRFFLAAVTYVISTPVLWITGWHVDAASAWKKIPHENKMYSAVRDNNAPLFDGVIHDQFSSIASIEENTNNQAGPYFVPSKEAAQKSNYRGPHFIARRNLISNHSSATHTNHDFFIDEMRKKFGIQSDNYQSKDVDKRVSMESPLPANCPERPLILACSGGVGHISAAQGIIDHMKARNPQVQVTKHQATLYVNKPTSATGLMLRMALWVSSVPGLGFLFKFLLSSLGYPDLPDYSTFWEQMDKLQNAETVQDGNGLKGRERSYVDVLVDFYDSGYEFTALNNASHLSLNAQSLKKLLAHKASVEKSNYQSVYIKTLNMLKKAAENQHPFTQLISTQALSLDAICDAVIDYNQIFLPLFNQKNGTDYSNIYIEQYLTDLPEPGCVNFLKNLDCLTNAQKSILEIHAVNIREPIKAAFFNKEQGFKAIYNIAPNHNPMVHAGFKDTKLQDYTQFSKPQTLTFLDKDNYRQSAIINAHAKVASIMIGSLAANASVDYVKHLLDKDYDHIFIFGGLNNRIAPEIDAILEIYPPVEQDKIKQKMILLPPQTDIEMAPIMARSHYVIIRGGGLSVMEQMAIPIMRDKTVLVHHDDTSNDSLTSGIDWEDSNTDALIYYLRQKGCRAFKTSPTKGLDGLPTKRSSSGSMLQTLSEEQSETPPLSTSVNIAPEPRRYHAIDQNNWPENAFHHRPLCIPNNLF